MSNETKTTNIANRPQEPGTALAALLKQSEQQIKLALPKHLTPERMIRMALTTFRRNPSLHQCDPVTIVGCVVQASELGLELSGPLGQAYMIPRYNKHMQRNEANFQIGYRGFLRLAFNSGMVSHFSAHEVHENDLLQFQYGTDQKLIHIPARADRGDLAWFYSTIKTKDGGVDFEVMSVEDMYKHRDRYRSQKSGGPWDDNFIEMGNKTMIRKLAKRAPVSAELMMAAVNDEYNESSAPIQEVAQGMTMQLPNGRMNLKEIPNEESLTQEVSEDADKTPVAEPPVAETPKETPKEPAKKGEKKESAASAESKAAPTIKESQIEEIEHLMSMKGGVMQSKLLTPYGLKKLEECSEQQGKEIIATLNQMQDVGDAFEG